MAPRIKRFKAYFLILGIVISAVSTLVTIVYFISAESNSPLNRHRHEDPILAQFRNCDGYEACFRAAAVSDSAVDGISVKALTKAFFDSTHYSPSTVYIFTHPAGDTLTVTTSDQPLLSRWEFSQFYRAHSDRGYADTIVSPRFFDKFSIEPKGIVDFERFDLLPFLFLDVTFDGKPELLIRRLLNSNYFYRFQAYEITDQGFRVLDDEPFTSLKNRNSGWVFGGASKIDYDNKTISTSAITPGSCSDYGSTVSNTYTLDPTTGQLTRHRVEHPYDFNE